MLRLDETYTKNETLYQWRGGNAYMLAFDLEMQRGDIAQLISPHALPPGTLYHILTRRGDCGVPEDIGRIVAIYALEPHSLISEAPVTRVYLKPDARPYIIEAYG